jgi:cysteine desulfurase
MKQKCDIEKLCYGGEQEKSYRAGTENVAFIVALTMALKCVHINRVEKTKELYKLRNYIKKELSNINIDVIEPKYGVTPNTLLIIVKGIDTCNKSFAIELSNKYNVCLGISSACQTAEHKSHVLEAMKLDEVNKDKVIRISMSDYTTMGECKYLVDCFKKLVEKHRKND